MNTLPMHAEGMEDLLALALDLRSSWHHAPDELWRRLDPRLWELTHNPWVVLQTVSRDQIECALADHDFRSKLEDLTEQRRQLHDSPAWFQQHHAPESLSSVAYFSLEFMLSEALPIYSGGLGNVAGDQLKAASDLGVPVVAVGLLYQQGYFRQAIDQDGSQQALYPYNDPGQLPITPLRQENGEWLRLEIGLPGYSVWLRAWQAQVGRVRLLLLDSNDAANFPVHRGITSELYGGGPELRLKQELVLGIGGWRLLQRLGIQPDVCHLNEGHAAFAVLERARAFMETSGQPFEVALAVTRAGNLFTTHTAVAAGFDCFSPALIDHYLRIYAEQQLGISLMDLLALGRLNPSDDSEGFNMAFLALRGSGAVNAVSRLHEQVSQRIFQPLFPRWPRDEVPIGHVTNGVHMPSWDSEEADELWTQACGKDRWLGTTEGLAQGISQVSDEALWQFRQSASKRLIEFIRTRLTRELAAAGALAQDVEEALELFDPSVLTLGFARRFATYKRPNLMLHDRKRLLRILNNAERPVQLVIAGKAHPQDMAGQQLIREWIHFIRQTEVRPRIVFLSDYDMLLTEHLVQGVDVWINTPRRPWEACGTSGMKVLVNGGINLSELDGWWAEAYTPEVGWALGDGEEHGDDPAWDAAEANAMYDLLEQRIVPEFYTRHQRDIPIAWVARMRASMAQLTPQYSANRTVRQYTLQHYLPAAAAYRSRSAENGLVGERIVEWQRSLTASWSGVHFESTRVETVGHEHVFEARINLNGIDLRSVIVELFASGIAGGPPVRIPMQCLSRGPGNIETLFTATTSAERPAGDYVTRLLPQFAGLTVPLEESHILWER